jgi:hypothetical protein
MKPNPSDFGDYAYCGIKWILKKTRPQKSTFLTQKGYDLILGQKNEPHCIKWVSKKYNTKSIIYNGTQQEIEAKTLTAFINGVSLDCKPDLIIKKDNKNLLFEFKATSKQINLLRSPFNSFYAQVWCYSHINEIKIDEFHLIRYFIEPDDIFTQDEEITFDNSIQYEQLFDYYIKAIEAYQYGLKNKMLSFLHPPKDNVTAKCKSCVYSKREICAFGTERINENL